MDNLTYEFFIRRCWQCERFKHGANTDTWDDLLSRYYNFKNGSRFSTEKLEKDYLQKLNHVKDYINKAYAKLISVATKKKISQDTIHKIISYQTVVSASIDPDEIFETLNKSVVLMNDNNLQMFK